MNINVLIMFYVFINVATLSSKLQSLCLINPRLSVFEMDGCPIALFYNECRSWTGLVKPPSRAVS